MGSFVVSARKYRPATFDTVLGQSAITITLKNAIRQNQLAQAFLFCGPRGVGKTTCARILAKTINCQNITENIEPCNECESCRNFNTTASFNIYELDAASNNSVDDIRSLIDQVRIPPQTGKYKVYIIDEVHMLSQQAFNAFLKTLEEPPPYAKFILATTEKHKVIPTILSRCQIFDFKRIGVEDIISQLNLVARAQEIMTDDDALYIIAQKADGSMRDALSIFDQMANFSGKEISYAKVIENLNVLDYDYYFKMTRHIAGKDLPSALILFDEILEGGFEGQHFLAGFASHLRNLLVCSDAGTLVLLDVGESIRSQYKEQSATLEPAYLMRALDLCNQYDLSYKTSNHKRLHIEILLMQLCYPGDGKKIPSEAGNTQPSPEKKTPAPADTIIPKIQPTPAPKAQAPDSSPKTIAAKPAPTATLKGSLSIKKIVSSVEKERKELEDENTIPENAAADFFDDQRLEEVWSDIAEQYKNSSPSFHTILLKRKPLKKEDHLIEFCIENKLQETELKQKKKEILRSLRHMLNNYSIDLQLLVTQNHKEDKPYTAVDKFKKMAELNPAIMQLKEKLDLDLEI